MLGLPAELRNRIISYAAVRREIGVIISPRSSNDIKFAIVVRGRLNMIYRDEIIGWDD